MEQATAGMQYVFLFTLAAGLCVLYASVQSTLDERRYETAIVRTLGANRATIIGGLLAEFLVLGLVAGTLGAAGATGLGAILATQVFGLAFHFNPWLWVAGILAGTGCIGAAGLLGTRSILAHPPLATLRHQ